MKEHCVHAPERWQIFLYFFYLCLCKRGASPRGDRRAKTGGRPPLKSYVFFLLFFPIDVMKQRAILIRPACQLLLPTFLAGKFLFGIGMSCLIFHVQDCALLGDEFLFLCELLKVLFDVLSANLSEIL